MPYLRSINTADQQPYPLTKDSTILGRAKQADLILGGDGVSREHARRVNRMERRGLKSG